MSEKMLKFVKIGQQTPPKREVGNRKEDFNEIYKEFINDKASEQSSRCSQCGVPFCQVHCPLSNLTYIKVFSNKRQTRSVYMTLNLK